MLGVCSISVSLVLFFVCFFVLPPGREDPLEKEVATHSGTLAWEIPRTEECGRLQSMQSQRVGYDGATSLSL